jgi:hypothetical protein
MIKMSKDSFALLFFIKSFTENLEKDIKELKIKLENCKENSEDFYELPLLEKVIDDYNILCTRINSLSEIDQFSSLSYFLSYIPKNILMEKDRPELKTRLLGGLRNEIDEALSILEAMRRRCSALLRSLEVLLKPEIPLNVTTQLGLLKKEIKKIQDELEPAIYSDIEEAINEMEQGHDLAATLIASRVIRYVLDKIPGENDEKKANKLIELKIIEKGRKDEYQRFIIASRFSRNMLSHNVGFRLKLDEGLQLVSSAVTFARYFVKMSHYNQNEENK